MPVGGGTSYGAVERYHVDGVDSRRRVADPEGSKRVLRGGSWNNNARNVRAAQRNRTHPDNQNDNIGFRLARARTGTGRSRPDPIRLPSAAPAAANRPWIPTWK
ncbi:MAG: SUMF1/EgtB/PvdO family nonheme iron enzyme [bacterium]|nr:SUMF1/EgtB/PvdO family nonheme iron enzyme [bacterium]